MCTSSPPRGIPLILTLRWKCAALLSQNSLAGRVLTSRDDGFEARLDSYYSANAANPPQCMVLPQSKKDVATTIQVLSEIGCAFGMRSGAHSAFAGSNGLEGGVTIDFGKSTAFNALAFLMQARIHEFNRV